MWHVCDCGNPTTAHFVCNNNEWTKSSTRPNTSNWKTRFSYFRFGVHRTHSVPPPARCTVGAVQRQPRRAKYLIWNIYEYISHRRYPNPHPKMIHFGKHKTQFQEKVWWCSFGCLRLHCVDVIFLHSTRPLPLSLFFFSFLCHFSLHLTFECIFSSSTIEAHFKCSPE